MHYSPVPGLAPETCEDSLCFLGKLLGEVDACLAANAHLTLQAESPEWGGKEPPELLGFELEAWYHNTFLAKMPMEVSVQHLLLPQKELMQLAEPQNKEHTIVIEEPILQHALASEGESQVSDS